MLPKLEKAKQVRASMVLEEQNIASGTIVPGDSSMGGQKVKEDFGDTVPFKMLVFKLPADYPVGGFWEAYLRVHNRPEKETMRDYVYNSSSVEPVGGGPRIHTSPTAQVLFLQVSYRSICLRTLQVNPSRLSISTSRC